MSDVHEQLLAFLTAKMPAAADLAVTEPVALGGGSSKLNWSFDASWTHDGEKVAEALVLRQEPIAGVVDSDVGQEYAVLSALAVAGAGLPVPVARFGDLEPTWFDRRSIVVERLEGAAHRAVLREKDPLGLGADGRLALAGSLADLLAAVHTVDFGMAALREPGDDPALTELENWEEELDDEALDPDARLRPARTWLHANLPTPLPKLRLVHGDFRPANVLIDGGEIRALLDWELAHFGDPADDLGWYTCSIYRAEHFPPGWTVSDFLARYVAGGGIVAEPERLRFWQVLSVLRLAVIALRGARHVEQGLAEGPPPPADRVIAQVLADIEN